MTGKYQPVVDRGLNWLIEHQTSEGDLFAAESEFAGFYSHGIAAIALCEAFGMTKDAQSSRTCSEGDRLHRSRHNTRSSVAGVMSRSLNRTRRSLAGS